MRRDVDIVIIGGGCAGLSLAAQLADRGTAHRVAVLEPREEYANDRTWCFFAEDAARRDPDAPISFFANAITNEWASWRVATPRGDVVRSAEGLSYVHVSSARFYAEASSRLRRSSNVSLELGTSVTNVTERSDDVLVETDRGSVLASRVFDSRPRRFTREGHHGAAIDWVQDFVGHFVETDRDAFDPSCVTLMDFRVSQLGSIHFAYVLPFGSRSALVESTFFGPVARAVDIHEATIAEYLKLVLGAPEARVIRREGGALPMTTIPPPEGTRRVTPIGLRGGAAKPSTGYAFLAIQRAARELARRLDGDVLAPGPAPRGHAVAALDAIMLSRLARAPAGAPDIFLRLFDRVPPRTLARFLSETATASETLAVMRALPTFPFAVEAARSARSWLPRRTS